MYTAACSVKGRPQERAGAVITFLKTFVSASSLSLSLSLSSKCLPPKIVLVLLVLLSCLVFTCCVVFKCWKLFPHMHTIWLIQFASVV